MTRHRVWQTVAGSVATGLAHRSPSSDRSFSRGEARQASQNVQVARAAIEVAPRRMTAGCAVNVASKNLGNGESDPLDCGHP